jgi:hypothetical protein
MTLLLASPFEALPADPFPGIDPCWVMLHEPAVLAELKLSPPQRQKLDELMGGLDLRVFPLRNKRLEELLPELHKIYDEGKQGVNALLQPAQDKRLAELFMRRLGTAGLLREDLAAQVRLSETQRKEIEKIVNEAQTAVSALEKELNEGQPRDSVQKKFVALKTDEQKKILRLLKPEQHNCKGKWSSCTSTPAVASTASATIPGIASGTRRSRTRTSL